MLAHYRGDATYILSEPIVADRQFGRVLPLLNTLRYMPAGYASRDETAPVLAGFGLSQYGRLKSAALTAYQVGLERMLRPRLIFRLEEQLDASRNSPSVLFEALKVYLMIGGRPEAPLDRDLVIAWMRRDWAENLFPGQGFARGRELLEEHLRAMLDLETGAPFFSINASLVEDCQRILAGLSVAERAYEILKSDARTAVQRDWTAVRAGGPDTIMVFEAVGGDLDSVRVPFFFTYAGFYEAFIDRFGDVKEAVDRDRWVLGPAGEQPGAREQYRSLFSDLLKLYGRDFVPAWNQALALLKLRSLSSDMPRYLALQAVASPTSPFKRVIESLRDETWLTRERSAASKSPSGLLILALSNNAVSVGNMEAAFRQFHYLVVGSPGERTVDEVIDILNGIKNAALTALVPAETQAANATLITKIRALRSVAPRFPTLFELMLQQVANEFESMINNASPNFPRTNLK
ncbi:ImcF-related family protein [Methylobacterium sp. EM32]|uniref:ImcF-related family protein n=1 Tax=Methylobacterium sp. EM32 TaxID=3163481 RepID=UPI0033BF1524